MAAGDDGFDADEWLARQFGQPPPPSGDRPPAAAEQPPPTEPAPTEPAPTEPPPAEPTPTPPPLVEPPFPVHPDVPTQAMDLSELEAQEPAQQEPALPPEQPMFRSRRRRAEQPPAVDPALEGTELLGVPDAVGVPAPPGEGHEPPPPTGEALDALFGAGAFQEYADEPLVQTARQPRVVADAPPAGPRPGIGRTQKILLWIAGGLVAVLALLAIFLIGTRIAHLFGQSPAVVASPTPTPSPTVTTPALGPLPPGTYAWDELLGTECLQPYESPWQEEYTVVECTQAHAAQLVKRGTFPEEPAYPGLEQLASRMNLLCTDPSVIDYSLTAGITDLQFAASFAATAAEWQDGHHDYFCFVNRSSGEPLGGTIARPPVAPTPAP